MDDTEFGLGAAVFTPDRDTGGADPRPARRGQRLLESLPTARACALPWAGRRHSGLGTSMSESGVRAFVREKAWHLGA